MEKRISAKTRLYFQNFKDILKDKIVKDAKLNPNDMNDLVQFIYDYPLVHFYHKIFKRGNV